MLICQVWLTQGPEGTVSYPSSKEDFSGSVAIRSSSCAHLPSEWGSSAAVFAVDTTRLTGEFLFIIVKNNCLIVKNKGHSSGNRLVTSSGPSPVNSLIRQRGRGYSGPVALAVLSARWLFCKGREMGVCSRCYPRSQVSSLGECKWCLTYAHVLLPWLLKSFSHNKLNFGMPRFNIAGLCSLHGEELIPLLLVDAFLILFPLV